MEGPMVSKEALARKFGYFVVFETTNHVDTPYEPFLTLDGPYSARDVATLPHGLSRDGLSSIQALWYCLHLPSTAADLIDLPARILKYRQRFDLAHAVTVMPLGLLSRFSRAAIENHVHPILMIAPDRLLDAVKQDAARLGMLLEVFPSSELTEESLRRHWGLIQKHFTGGEGGHEPVLLTDHLDSAPLILPTRWLLRQCGDQRTMQAPDSEEEFLTQYRQALHIQAVIAATAKLEREKRTLAEAEPMMEQTIRDERRSLSIPVAVGAPGVSSAYLRKIMPEELASIKTTWPLLDASDRFDSLLPSIDDYHAERATLELLVAHRAVGRSGVGITLPSLPNRLFELMGELERHCARGRPRARAIQRWLREIGAVGGEYLGPEVSKVLARASMLTIFSNFPLGLAVLPGDTAPLACRAPVAYRPIIPLTRALQMELRDLPIIYWGSGFKMLIAECIPTSDAVGRLSRAGWDQAQKTLQEHEPITVVHAAVNSASELREQIQRYTPDVLVLSAHGWFDENRNAAGIRIGDDICLGPELGSMPPLVILSACHVAPRGVGAVSIADLLIRQGAIAVLGTQIPVHVVHNSILMTRFFVYVVEVVKGREGHRTVDEVWHRAVTSNAMNDLFNGNSSIRQWAISPFNNNTVLETFMQERSSGRLRRSHIYADTEAVLLEMATEQGIGDRFRQWLAGGYVPESLFYVFIGSPDRIFLREPEIAELAEEIES